LVGSVTAAEREEVGVAGGGTVACVGRHGNPGDDPASADAGHDPATAITSPGAERLSFRLNGEVRLMMIFTFVLLVKISQVLGGAA
jgi:hypothetical protein